MRARRVLAPVAVLAAVGLPLAACSDGDDTSSATTTSAAESSSSEYLAAAEERGEPMVEATDPVTELVITDDVVGTGAEVTEGDTVTAHYVGVAASTGEVFDSSWSSGQPLQFPLANVIPGWQQGLIGMKEGGRRTLVIPADLAYGDSGPAPGDSLVFTVDLVAVN